MNQKINNLSDVEANAVVRMAWRDRTTFDQIKCRTGLSEADVIKLMRRELKPCSFRLWRKRVSGRITKHRKLLERYIKPSH
jgi:uncharacterized protein (TIGR03643 family)